MDKTDIEKLYNSELLHIMQTAEEALERGSDRINEIRNFASKSGIKRIGIAHCVAFPKEVEFVKIMLSEEFEVYSVDCKCGKIAKHQMLGGESNALMCNPAGQAAFLREQGTELNISMGLCVGHDMIFNSKSAAPVTTLLVKDRANKHNPMETFTAKHDLQ